MTIAPLLLGVAALVVPQATTTAAPLWNGIAIGQDPTQVARRAFVDARGASHAASRSGMIGDFYLWQHAPATVRILYHGKPQHVCGVDVEGARAALAKEALLADLGPPASRFTDTLLDAPGGAAALLSGGKLFRVSIWHRGPTIITFEERVRPGYFAILYRGTDSAGDRVDC